MSDSSTQHEYIVTVKAGVDWQVVNDELTRDTAADASVDSAIVPDRSVDVAKLRSNNKRNTHYALTDAEAQALRNDSRIEAVERKDIIGKPTPGVLQDGPWQRGINDDYQNNWGLIRHTDTELPIQPGDSAWAERYFNRKYQYVLDGTGVDVVIQDSGIQADHPEFQDAYGTSRVQQIDWSQYDSNWTSGTVTPYQDTDGHGTHVAGTVAGKKVGWAKNARIYSQNLLADTSAMSTEDSFDSLISWHNSKNGSRPTVVNMSYGFIQNLVPTENGNSFIFFNTDTQQPDSQSNGGVFRGTNESTQQLSFWTGRGLSYTRANEVYNGVTYLVYKASKRVASIDADVQQALDAGIIMVKAAGNNSQHNAQKTDVPGGQDWDNKLTGVGGLITDYYYCRGASPTTDSGNDINVGALSASGLNGLEAKAYFSNAGPGVDLYAAGQAILSSYPTNTYSWQKGTSMASPQVAGMCACLLQAHPDWTPAQVKNYMINNSVTGQLYFLDIADDSLAHFETYGEDSLQTGPNRIAYFPMNGASPFGYSSS